MKEGEKIILSIEKNVSNIKWECIIKNCKVSAINSHIYQQNGILNSIAEKGHVMEVKPINIFKWQDKNFSEIISFKKIGVNQAHSYPTLCNHHDTIIFANIEKHPVDLESYHNQLLFFYRTLLSSKRKEQIVLEKEKRIVNSKILNSTPSLKQTNTNSKKNIEVITKMIALNDTEIGIMESDLDKSEMAYKIYKIEYPLIKAYAISINICPTSHKFIYTNVFPYNGKTIILIGSLKENNSAWTQEYIKSWENLSINEFEIRLTTYLSKNSENWGLSPKIVSNINHLELKKFYKLRSSMIFNINLLLDLNYRTDYNFFYNKNYGI